MKSQKHLPVGGLEELRKKYCSILEDSEEFRIIDIGFGTGTNTLLAINHIRKNFGDKNIVIYGIDNDKYLLDYLDKQNLEQINDFDKKILSSLAKHRLFESNNLKIRLIDGDVRTAVDKLPSGFNFAFYDLFGPNEQQHLWNEDIFTRLQKKMNSGAKLATHTSATDVRINLVRAGFEVFDGPEIWPHFHCTHARKLD